MMNFKKNKKIYLKVKEKNIETSIVCEVGVYLPETSNIIDFISDGKKTILVEPNPPAILAINNFFKDFSNIKLYPFAIYKTFVSDLPASPALINDSYQQDSSKNVEVECRLFSEIDEGNIDLLSIDTEGCEWYVLETMISRPKVISIETHGKFYINPFMDKIANWALVNGYKIWFKDKSDTVYYKSDLFKVSIIEIMQLLIMNIYLKFRYAKKIFYGK